MNHNIIGRKAVFIRSFEQHNKFENKLYEGIIIDKARMKDSRSSSHDEYVVELENGIVELFSPTELKSISKINQISKYE